jgi:hypothetical protein
MLFGRQLNGNRNTGHPARAPSRRIVVLTFEHFNHARGLEQVHEAVEPAVLLRGLDDVGGLHGPSPERYRYGQCDRPWQCGIVGGSAA